MKKSDKIFMVFCFIIFLSGSAFLIYYIANTPRHYQKDTDYYAVNDIGLTYGGTYPDIDILPDLLSVTNEDGVSGYIYIKEIFNKMPKNPQEAAEIGYEFNCTVPIYDADGITELGEFHFGDSK